MTNTRIISQIRFYLTEHFDYIGKLDAMRTIKKVFGDVATIAMIIEAYKSIEQYK